MRGTCSAISLFVPACILACAAAAFTALAAQGASAMPPLAECPTGLAHDLGGGLVSVTGHLTDSSGAYSSREIVTHCSSGQSLMIGLATEADIAKRAQHARNIVRQAVISTEVVTLEELLQRLRTALGYAEFDSSVPADRETCACAAYYPDLRGTKEPWSD